MKSHIVHIVFGAILIILIVGLILFHSAAVAPFSSPPKQQSMALAEPAITHPNSDTEQPPIIQIRPETSPFTPVHTLSEPQARPNLPANSLSTSSDSTQSDLLAKRITAAQNASVDIMPEPQIPEPLARAALNYVGIDPVAEATWLTAINDPALPDKARQNLIEDLNENGLSDPDHPSIDDLPLIQSRLSLLEQIGPDALDNVNAAAFQEAYKDLINMQAKLIGP